MLDLLNQISPVIKFTIYFFIAFAIFIKGGSLGIRLSTELICYSFLCFFITIIFCYWRGKNVLETFIYNHIIFPFHYLFLFYILIFLCIISIIYDFTVRLYYRDK